MRLIIKDNYDDCSLWAANYIAYKIQTFRPTPKKPFVLGLPTGSTPLGTYRELIKMHKEGKLSFANVVTFNMDEYTADTRKAIVILCTKISLSILIFPKLTSICLTE